MVKTNIVHSSTWTPSVFVSSGSPLAITTFVLGTNTEEYCTIAVPAPAMISSSRVSWSRRLSNRARRAQWVAAQSFVPPEANMAPRSPPQMPGIGAPETPPNPATTEEPPKPAKAKRIQLAIDSLQNYEILKPIPVLVESLGDTVFVAEAPDLNVSITGNSVGSAFLLLKDHIINIYEGYRSKKGWIRNEHDSYSSLMSTLARRGGTGFRSPKSLEQNCPGVLGRRATPLTPRNVADR